MKMDSIKLAAVAGLSLSAAAALAQDKTDGLWRGAGGAALAATSGNTSSSSVLLNADAQKATTTDKVTLGAAINYARNKNSGVNQTTANKWGAFGQYDYKLSPALYVFGRLGLDSDQLVDLNLRSSVAGGLGYKLISTPTTTFELLGGAGYSSDRYDSTQTIAGKTGTRFSRSSLYVAEASAHQLSPTVSFKQRLDLYPGLSGDKAMIAKFVAGLAVALNSTMNLNVGLTDTYNSKPAAGTKANDLGLFTGINVKFGAL
jgi:putative salt-induced outer membrane protein